MSCGCKTSGDSSCGCSTKATTGCEQIDTCGNSYKLNIFDWLSQVKVPQNQCNFVEVRFKNDRKAFYHNVHRLSLHIGSIVAVESNPGYDTGMVSLMGELVRIQMKKENISETQVLKVYRIASQKDVEIWQEARKKEDSVKVEARKIARRLNLEMKITDVEYQADGTKITFYYTAEGRVDFRQLIKEYAVAFRTKIDMKQIGYRQEAAKVGGIGSCGRELCCSTWLTDFRSVNTNAARYQQLSINPLKLAGQCGKLKCCLNFELDSYVDALSHFPSSNTVLDTEKGKAFCIKVDVFKKRMWFAYVDNSMLWYDLSIDKVKELIAINKKGSKICPLEEYKNQDFSTAMSKEVDLIQESDIDRFEKKKFARKKSKRAGEKQGDNDNVQNKKTPKISVKFQETQTEKGQKEGQQPTPNRPQQKKFSDKKRKPQSPKKDNDNE